MFECVCACVYACVCVYAYICVYHLGSHVETSCVHVRLNVGPSIRITFNSHRNACNPCSFGIRESDRVDVCQGGWRYVWLGGGRAIENPQIKTNILMSVKLVFHFKFQSTSKHPIVSNMYLSVQMCAFWWNIHPYAYFAAHSVNCMHLSFFLSSTVRVITMEVSGRK